LVAEHPKKGLPAGGDTKPGAVKHDTRGNAVWQWAVDTGKHALDSTSALLRRLELPGLSIEDDKPAPKPAAPTEAEIEVEKRQGYDPYGRQKRPASAPATPSPSAARPSELPPRQAASRPLSPPAPAPAPRPSSWWSRLFSHR
jgi:hypothetical protein